MNAVIYMFLVSVTPYEGNKSMIKSGPELGMMVPRRKGALRAMIGKLRLKG